jgi:hypothetical protein
MQIKFTIYFLATVFSGVFSWAHNSEAATYYISTNGSDFFPGTCTDSSPCATISKGLTKMSGGDTLIVKNGTYTDRTGMMLTDYRAASIPSGAAGAFTTIRAETPFGVRIKFTSGPGYYRDAPVVLYRANYVNVDGFIYEQLGENPQYVVNVYSSWNKITRCIVKRNQTDMYGGWYASAANDVLFEDCHGVGAARYGFYAGGPDSTQQRTVFRRCVGRFDFSHTKQPKSTFAIYGNNQNANVTNFAFQNCIAIDGHYPPMPGASGRDYEEKYGAFYHPKTATNIRHDGVIVLNEGVGHAGMFVQEWGTGITVKNTVVYNLPGSQSWAVGIRSKNADRASGDHVTIGGSIPGGATENIPLTNSRTSGVPTNILNNTPGAVILYKHGTSGTFWGETGWDTITNESLWPFPYEAEIKAVFAEQIPTPTGYNPSGNVSARGFAASGNGLYGGPKTLTSYIWEYTGTPCPTNICSGGGGGGDTTPPTLR